MTDRLIIMCYGSECDAQELISLPEGVDLHVEYRAYRQVLDAEIPQSDFYDERLHRTGYTNTPESRVYWNKHREYVRSVQLKRLQSIMPEATIEDIDSDKGWLYWLQTRCGAKSLKYEFFAV